MHNSFLVGKKLAMTAPVLVKVYSDAGRNGERTFKVSFYVGKEHWQNAPEPLDTDVILERLPSVDIYCRCCSGLRKQ